MNILLVYPPFPKSFWSFTYALEIYHRKALLPPLGLLTAAALLPAHWGKRLVDLNVRELTDDDLQWADCVFVSGMGVQRAPVMEIATRCRRAGKRLVGGGPLFTAGYSLFQDFDHFILNEAEALIPQFAADLENHCARRIYRARGNANLKQSPTPLWNLLDINQYAVMGIQYSRGCPYDCEFCNVTAMLGRNPRTKTPAQILAELDSLRAAGWTGRIFFVDDNLIGHRPALKNELLPALIDWQQRNGPVTFCTQASINLADDPALMDQMTRAGFDCVFVGIETTDPAALTECGKSQNQRRNILDSVKILQRAGIEVQAGFIVGFDNDTQATFGHQADFIEESGIVTAMVGQLQAPPGTRLIARMWREGRLRGHSTGDNTDGSTNIIPTMGVEALRDGYKSLLQRIFAPDAVYRRIRTFLREFGTPRIRRKVSASDWAAFFRSLWMLGILSDERFEYWRLLLWTLCMRPRHLPAAVRLAVCSHHYRRIMQQQVSRPPPEPLVIGEPMDAAIDVTVSRTPVTV